MPVIEIAALPQPPGVDVTAAMEAVTAAVSEILGTPRHGTWVTWRTIEPDRYIEGDEKASYQPRDTHPPLVTIRAFQGRDPAAIERTIEAVATTLAEALSLEPGAGFVIYDEIPAGRVYTGGGIRR